jgi:hypothetical protein
MARPIVMLARKPGPNTPPAPLIPSSAATGPLTTISGAGPDVDCQPPPPVERSSISASHAASTTGKYSGRQPAIAALIAASCTVTALSSCGSRPITSSAGRSTVARNRSSSGCETGTSGRPSDQPWA